MTDPIEESDACTDKSAEQAWSERTVSEMALVPTGKCGYVLKSEMRRKIREMVTVSEQPYPVGSAIMYLCSMGIGRFGLETASARRLEMIYNIERALGVEK